MEENVGYGVVAKYLNDLATAQVKDKDLMANMQVQWKDKQTDITAFCEWVLLEQKQIICCGMTAEMIYLAISLCVQICDAQVGGTRNQYSGKYLVAEGNHDEIQDSQFSVVQPKESRWMKLKLMTMWRDSNLVKYYEDSINKRTLSKVKADDLADTSTHVPRMPMIPAKIELNWSSAN